MTPRSPTRFWLEHDRQWKVLGWRDAWLIVCAMGWEWLRKKGAS